MRLQLLWQTARSPDRSPGTPCASLAAIRWDSRITFSIINVLGLPRVPKRSHTHRPVLRSLTKSWLSFSALPGWGLKRPLTNEECTMQKYVKVRFVLKPQGTCAALAGLWFLKLTSLCWLQLWLKMRQNNLSPTCDPFPPPCRPMNALRLLGYGTGLLFALRYFSLEHLDDTLSVLCNLLKHPPSPSPKPCPLMSANSN